MAINRFCCFLYVKGLAFAEKCGPVLLLSVGLLLLQNGLSTGSLAQTGDTIFKDSACSIHELLGGDFGAMITSIAGLLAIVAAVAGSFKGAWALLVVSIGCYLGQTLVGELFEFSCTQ